nr:bro [Helicoverpa armigera nucleopolyhedrovirus]
MSVTKIKFGDKEVETYTVDFNGEKWMVANPFAEALSYSNVNRAIRVHVSEKNQQNYEEFKSDRVGLTDSVTSLPRNIQAKTKFINRAGVFELINASDMPGAKRFQAWNNNDLLPSLCQEGEYKMARDAPADIAHGMNAVHVATNDGAEAPWMKDLHELRDAVVQKDKIIQAMSYENKQLILKMAVVKVHFNDRELEIISVKDDAGKLWMLANPFALVLNYGRPNDAIRNHVTDINVRNYEYFKARRFNVDDVTLHPMSKFINRAGLFELIQASRMPKAQEFRDWINSDLLPKLCDDGKYDMAADAPKEIANGMNAVHAITNEGKEAPWMEDFREFKLMLSHKDELLAVKDKENEALTVALQNANHNLAVANQGLLKAFDVVNDARKETAEIAKRMADIAQDVIAKPSDPQLLHSLAVCSMGGDQYAFLRPQKRSLKRSLDRLSVDEKDIVYKSDYVPNSMNVLNKVKERLPKEKYKARHNRITLHEDLTREDLLQAIESTVSSRQVAIIVNKATSNITSIGNNTTNK